MSEDRTKLWSLKRSIAVGAIGFGLVSLFVFATVAYGERRMYQNLGMLGAYLTWTVTFIVLSAAVFGTLVVGRWRLPKFYLLFSFAFFAYAVAWMIAYYNSPNTAGEVIGSLAGSVLMALVFALAFESIESTVKLSAVLFVSNFLGYFIGSALNNSLHGQIGMLLWGVVYGLFFGAGIGAALHLVQRR
jgi:small-conductance mechanosensitive channel